MASSLIDTTPPASLTYKLSSSKPAMITQWSHDNHECAMQFNRGMVQELINLSIIVDFPSMVITYRHLKITGSGRAAPCTLSTCRNQRIPCNKMKLWDVVGRGYSCLVLAKESAHTLTIKNL